MMSVYNIHENLIEVLLEMQSYPDVQAVLSKYDGTFFFSNQILFGLIFLKLMCDSLVKMLIRII